jgi:predicted ATPase
VVGVGGVGKTRLAVRAAAELAPEYADGVWLCELAGADDAESMHQLVASTVGIAPRPGLDLRASVVEYLVTKTILLLLDNCEHVIDPAAELADLARNKCPAVRVLATSREPLALEGERVFPLRSLSVPADGRLEGHEVSSEAVQLFVDRASAARPDFSLTSGNAATIAEVCRRLDGVPLAIELAAARVTSMAPAEIAAHLDERFRLLAGRRRGTVERHQTLRATLDWSYSLLSETDRRVFDRLGVFAASFDANAAMAVAGEGLESWDVLDAVADLSAKSMLLVDTTEEGTTRYRMLETLRHYARERLADHDRDSETWWLRHADYYAELARLIGDELNGRDEIAWRRRLAVELDDLRAAVNWSLDRPGDERCVQIVAALSVQAAQTDTAGIGNWAERCIERAQAAPAPLRTAVLAAAAWTTARQGDPRSLTIALDALRDGQPSGWPASYLPFMALSLAWALQGNFDEAHAVAARGHAALDASGAPQVGHTHLYCAEVFPTEDTEAAQQYAEAALANAQACNNPTGLAIGWATVGYAHASRDPQRAAAALEESIALTRKGGGDGIYGVALAGLAVLASDSGDAPKAIALLDEAARHGRDSGNQVTVGIAAGLGVVVMTNLSELQLAAILSGAGGETIGGMRAAGFNSRYDHAVAELRQTLGSSSFDAAFAKGAGMSHEQTAAFFISELARVRSSMADL